MAQQGAVAHGNGGDLRQPLHAFEGLQHAAGVGTHQTVVVEAVVRGDGPWIAVKQLIAAVMQAEGITGVEDAGAVVEGKDGVGPVEIWRAQKLKAVLHAAVWIDAQLQGVAAFHRPRLERPVHLVLQELDGHLGTHDLHGGVQVDQMANQPRVVGFGVGNDQIVDRHRFDLALQKR